MLAELARVTVTDNRQSQCSFGSELQVVGSTVGSDCFPVMCKSLFSSTSAVWSQAGAAHYSAANCHLNSIAVAWQHAGMPATAICFGPFGGTGMAAQYRWDLLVLLLAAFSMVVNCALPGLWQWLDESCRTPSIRSKLHTICF